MHMCYFRGTFETRARYCKMALLQCFKRTNKPKVALPSKLNSLTLLECQLERVNDHIRKIVGEEATSEPGIGKKLRHLYNDCANERTDIGKYASEIPWHI